MNYRLLLPFIAILVISCASKDNSETSQVSVTKKIVTKVNPIESLKAKRQKLKMKSDSLSDDRIHLKRYYIESLKWQKEEFIIELMGDEIVLQKREWGLQDCMYPRAVIEKWQHPISKRLIHFLLYSYSFEEKSMEHWHELEQGLDRRNYTLSNATLKNQKIKEAAKQEEFRKIEFYKNGKIKLNETRQINENIVFDSLYTEIWSIFK